MIARRASVNPWILVAILLAFAGGVWLTSRTGVLSGLANGRDRTANWGISDLLNHLESNGARADLGPHLSSGTYLIYVGRCGHISVKVCATVEEAQKEPASLPYGLSWGRFHFNILYEDDVRILKRYLN